MRASCMGEPWWKKCESHHSTQTTNKLQVFERPKDCSPVLRPQAGSTIQGAAQLATLKAQVTAIQERTKGNSRPRYAAL